MSVASSALACHDVALEKSVGSSRTSRGAVARGLSMSSALFHGRPEQALPATVSPFLSPLELAR